MRRTASLFTILTISMVVLVAVSFNIRAVKAQGDYTIEQVSHTIEIMYNGYVFINDTVTLNITGQAPTEFLIGFPDKYGPYILDGIALSNVSNLPLTLNVPLGNRVGFYGAQVTFPSGVPQAFTVGFIFSSELLKQDDVNSSQYTLSFPEYPSLTKTVGNCSVLIVPPQGATFTGGTVQGFSYAQENLTEFTRSLAGLSFALSEEKLQILDVTRLESEITINEFGEIQGVDSYEITNKAVKGASFVEVFLPMNASDPVAEDQFGRTMEAPRVTFEATNRYLINFTSQQIAKGQSTSFAVKYRLPGAFLTRESGNSFTLDLSLFQHLNYYINQTSVSFTFPEGAKISSLQSSASSDVFSITRNVFQERAAINRQGITSLNNLSIGIAYEYIPLWLSFRPTLWVWIVVIVGCAAVAVAWKRPTGPSRIPVSTAALKLGPEYLRSFVESYEEKMKISLELDSLEARVQKGKIPRRRYKVRRKMLETRLGALDRTLGESRERMRSAGGHYSGLMVQLEVAETELSEVATGIKDAEASHSRGELSLEAYRSRMAKYQQRKGDAESTINGILLRLREETR